MERKQEVKPSEAKSLCFKFTLFIQATCVREQNKYKLFIHRKNEFKFENTLISIKIDFVFWNMVETEVLSPKMCLLPLASVYYRILSLTIAYYHILVGTLVKRHFSRGSNSFGSFGLPWRTTVWLDQKSKDFGLCDWKYVYLGHIKHVMGLIIQRRHLFTSFWCNHLGSCVLLSSSDDLTLWQMSWLDKKT